MAEVKAKQYVSDNAQLMEEWDWERNNELGLDPKKLTCGSGKKAWWKCSKGHEWQATVGSRNSGCGCPYCSGRFAVKGKSDLQTIHPELAKEWNFEKNIALTPSGITANSGQKVWWKCSKGHEWQATVSNRVLGNGCPFCAKKYAIDGENDLQTVNPRLAQEWNYEKNGGLSPKDVLPGAGKKVWWKCSKGHEWQASILNRTKGNGCPVCNSERHTSFPEYALVYYLKEYGVDAIHSYRELGYELDVYIPSKRIGIEYDGYYWHKNKTEEDLAKNSNCLKDGIKLYRIRDGLSSLKDTSIDYLIQENQKNLLQVLSSLLNEITGANVDVDLKRDLVKIENLRAHTEKEHSLLFSNPDVSKEWNYDKNGILTPDVVLSSSGKYVWWKCDTGHEWQARIADRNSGRGCPYCSGRKVLKGFNDLKTVNPTLAKEWNYEKNHPLTPEDFTANSEKKVWWKCKEGHEWQATVGSRNSGCGCPYCSGRKVLKGFNDLKTVNPTLAKDWNYEKNGELSPEDCTNGSGIRVWWKCKEGHEWQATVFDRNSGRGCPYCSGRKVLKGFNDLKTANPTLAKEWNYEKNHPLTPEDFTANSGQKVWWKCGEEHEWSATIDNRNKGSSCPYCKGKRIIRGQNDLLTTNPSLAREWCYERNNGLTPMDVMLHSNKKVWWRCINGHEWQATPNNRSNSRGCPECARRNKKKKI